MYIYIIYLFIYFDHRSNKNHPRHHRIRHPRPLAPGESAADAPGAQSEW